MSPIKITPTNTIQIDEESRNKIACNHPYNNYLAKNLFVIAGAGSGKTSMLVTRMVKMVESGIDVSKICAITFTKKAAAEFLERFQKQLKERSALSSDTSNKRPGDLADPTEATAKLCKKALKDIDLCFTGTIDSFCNLVLSEYPNNAKIPSSSVVVMDDELIELCKKEYKVIANDPNHPLKNKFNEFNQLFSNGAEIFAKSIKDVMDVSHLNIQYNPPQKPAVDALKDLEKKYLAKITHDLTVINNSKANIANFPIFLEAYDNFTNKFKSLLKPWTLSGIQYFANTALKKAVEVIRFASQPTFQFFDTKYVKAAAGRPEGFEFVFKDNEYDKFRKEIRELVYTYALDFLRHAANDIREQLKKQGKLSFTEYLVTFRDMVKDDMRHGMHLINHIRNKHQYFLLDESQDTSPVQTELFLYLCSSVPAFKIEDCKPIPGSLFIVGYPKQSIYGFRGADVDAYLHTKQLFETVYDQNTHEVVYLTKNFRSSFELCEYFNEQFKTLPNYDPIPTSCIQLPPKNIENDVISGLFACENHISAIKSLVGKHYLFDKGLFNDEEKALKKNPHAFDKKPRTYGKRIITYKDIMLLTWTTTNHDRVIEELQKEHIPVFCEGRFNISGSDILQTIYALFTYIAREPGALANVLAAPLFGLELNAIAGISSINDLPNCPQRDILEAVEAYRSVDNPIIIFEKLIQLMNVYQFVDFINIEYVSFAIEKMKEAYNTGVVSDVKSAISFLKDFATTKLERCANLENKPNAVFLANVHKVKGLERPVVILVESIAASKKPATYSNFQQGKAYIFRTSEYEVHKTKMYNIDSGSAFDATEQVAIQKNNEEIDRLGYVAVTRARNILVIPPQSQANSAWRGIRPAKALDTIPGSDLGDIELEIVDGFNAHQIGGFNKNNSYIEMSPSKQAHIQNKQDVNPVNVSSNNDSTVKGSIVHRLMEMLVNSKGKIDKDTLVKTILNEFYLEQGSIYEAILNRVYDTMTSGGYPQKDKAVPQDLLKELDGAETYCECPYSYKENDEIWQGSIDLLYIKGNKYYIIDYKTNASDDDLDEIYEKQLEAYKVAINKATGKEAEAHIYHIDIK